MKHIFLLLILAALSFGIFFVWRGQAPLESATSEISAEQEEIITKPKETVRVYTIAEGDTFATVLEQFDIGYEQMLQIIDAASSTYDFTKIRLGRDIRFVYSAGALDRFEYDIDTESMVVAKKEVAGFVVSSIPIKYVVDEVYVQGTVTSSLFVAASKIGVSDATILEMAEIFAWSIDFATAIREGDSFTLFYEKRTRDGKPAQDGRVLAATFTNAGKTSTAYKFTDDDGKVAYYNDEGESLIRQFLKAPLRFSRISSGFTYARFHPTQQRNMPHRAIDYAAPAGTPIMAVGDGLVNYAGWNGGYGRYISIRHNETYETHYAHLSRFAKGIRNGTRVSQGDVIGFVGSTGWSTGPHLHYEIEKNGTLVNPLKIELPKGDPVSEERRAEFERVRTDLKGRILKRRS